MFHLYEKINQGMTYIIAEMSANHGGNLENALTLVRKAKEAGADCLKIQTYTADSITINHNSKDFQIEGGLWDGYLLYDLYQDAGTPYEWHETIKNECDSIGIDFLSTPFDFHSVDFLETLGCEAFKIASFELVDIPLIEYAAAKGKPMIISCGMGSIDEIQDAIDACHRAGNNQIILLKCCSEYPANWDNMHLSNIPDMKKRFLVPVGLSDHSGGCIASIIGVAQGACIIEKHIKLDNVSSPDSAFSMPWQKFSQMVSTIRDTEKIIGNVFYGPTIGEQSNLKFRRSLYAVKDINPGEAFTIANIRSIRPSNGLPPKYYNEILGKHAKTAIKKGDALTNSMIE